MKTSFIYRPAGNLVFNLRGMHARSLMSMTSEKTEATPDSLVLRNGRCPVYDGLRMAGPAYDYLNQTRE